MNGSTLTVEQSGTPAGDPVEAEAIHTAFYGPQSGFQRAPEDQKLLVGSIKTIIGHTEGTAGLASLLKASLALQHGEIVPNLHLDRLNPAVQPFYSNLEIPTEHRSWPTVEAGGVKRASVNSFGFGGAVSYTFACHRVAMGLTIPRMPTQSWRHTNTRMRAKHPLPQSSLPLSSPQAQNGLSRRR